MNTRKRNKNIGKPKSQRVPSRDQARPLVGSMVVCMLRRVTLKTDLTYFLRIVDLGGALGCMFGRYFGLFQKHSKLVLYFSIAPLRRASFELFEQVYCF